MLRDNRRYRPSMNEVTLKTINVIRKAKKVWLFGACTAWLGQTVLAVLEFAEKKCVQVLRRLEHGWMTIQ